MRSKKEVTISNTASMRKAQMIYKMYPNLTQYDAGFTLSTYTHATEGMKRSAADTIGSVISQAM